MIAQLHSKTEYKHFKGQTLTENTKSAEKEGLQSKKCHTLCCKNMHYMNDQLRDYLWEVWLI